MVTPLKHTKYYRRGIKFKVIKCSPETCNVDYTTVSVPFRKLSSVRVCWFASAQRDCPVSVLFLTATCMYLALLRIIIQLLCYANRVVKNTPNLTKK
jgi:hypothetical protein